MNKEEDNTLALIILQIEDLKDVVRNFHDDICPFCRNKLIIVDTNNKTVYRCEGCGRTWYENQHYETYFNRIEEILKNGN